MALLSSRTPQRVGSAAQMQALAAHVAQELVGGDVLLLAGELGSGKTTFVQGLARALGILEPITSPTFTLMVHYAVPHHPTIKTLVHLDVWRLSDEEVKREAALREALESSGRQEAVTIIEWADRLHKGVTSAYRIQFAYGDGEHERVVTYGD